MCSISVEPMPSRISTFVRSVKPVPIPFGSASPADVATRSDSCDAAGKAALASMPAYNVGTP
jgi:hypothetical protein